MTLSQYVKIITIIVASSGVCACDSLREYNQYDDLSAAREEGAIERGWIPNWMPESAVDIHEVHDLDTNIQAINFRLKPSRIFDWPEQCGPSNNPSKPRFKTELFPADVHKLPDLQNCRDYYAVQGANGIIHMWSPSE